MDQNNTAIPLADLTYRDIAALLWNSNRRLVEALAYVEFAATREEALNAQVHPALTAGD